MRMSDFQTLCKSWKLAFFGLFEGCQFFLSVYHVSKVYSCVFRLIRNPLGSTHPEATLKAALEHGAPEDAVQAAKAEFHAQLASKRGQTSSYDLVEDAELLSEDRELDSDNQGKSI